MIMKTYMKSKQHYYEYTDCKVCLFICSAIKKWGYVYSYVLCHFCIYPHCLIFALDGIVVYMCMGVKLLD